jgi:murein DD-endopeptidase MepM/ murein hydrolase activator NlpD
LLLLLAFIVGVGALRAVGKDDALDVGLLSPVFAKPAERVEVRELSSGQTVGGILLTAMDANEQHALLLALQEQASPRRMRPGTEVAFRWTSGTEEVLRGVDISLNADQTVRLSRTPAGWESEMVLTPVRTDTVFASGTIDGSLWNSMVGADDLEGVDPGDRAELIVQLAEIYQWQIDFDRQIRDGDYWRFAYERDVRPDGTTKAGRILSAELVNRRRSFSAVYFDANGDGKGTYYDDEGRSVKAAFLKSPIAFRHRVSSRFSNSRFHPILKRWRAHRGVDFGGVAPGTPIRSTGNGTIVRREWSDSYGNWIEVRHANGWTTRYAHMRAFRSGLRVGSAVSQGEEIGYVGDTGLAQGAHLHYEMRQNGDPKDPLAVDLPAGDPVPSDDWSAWQAQSADRVALLDDRVPRPWDVELTLRVRAADADSQSEGSD